MIAKTANDYREEAKQAEMAQMKSIESCDTDGCLSQWASGLTARLARTKAEILDNGGVAQFWGLFDLEGNRVAAKLIDGRYGRCWAICDEEGEFTGKFVTAFPKRASTMRGKGYVEAKETAPAYARIKGSGTGMSGTTSCYIATCREDNGYPLDAIVE